MEEIQDKQLNEKESLELIAQMIRNTRTKMEEGSGTMFLIWGYTTVIVTMLVWGLVLYFQDFNCQYVWFLLPIAGVLLTTIQSKRENRKPRATTYIDRIINYVWWVVGTAGFLLSMVSIMAYTFPILFVIVLIMGIGTTLTGLIISFRPLVISGIIGMASAVVLSFLSWKYQLPLFSLIFILMMIIPGHYLNYKAKKNNV